MICDRAKPGWVCIREKGHDGPCAAAPILGPHACPNVWQCMRAGCQAKCGPVEEEKKATPLLVQFWRDVNAWFRGMR